MPTASVRSLLCRPAPRKLLDSEDFSLSPTLQALMEDGKRETAVSMLPIVPEDSDTGRTYTCRVLNLAAPAGRQISVTINVQRECFLRLSSVVWAHLVWADWDKVPSRHEVLKVQRGAAFFFVCPLNGAHAATVA